jgi:hypothetical protein
MAHLSDWHEGFDVEDRTTYPHVLDSPVQLRFVNGFIVEFDSFRIFLKSKVFHTVPVRAWRYIKGAGL